jgi:hypothetical protein
MNYLINPALNIRYDFDNLQLKYIYFLLKPVAIDYQSSLSFELSDACQIKENKYILVVNYQSHTEYLKLDLWKTDSQ